MAPAVVSALAFGVMAAAQYSSYLEEDGSILTLIFAIASTTASTWTGTRAWKYGVRFQAVPPGLEAFET